MTTATPIYHYYYYCLRMSRLSTMRWRVDIGNLAHSRRRLCHKTNMDHVRYSDFFSRPSIPPYLLKFSGDRPCEVLSHDRRVVNLRLKPAWCAYARVSETTSSDTVTADAMRRPSDSSFPSHPACRWNDQQKFYSVRVIDRFNVSFRQTASGARGLIDTLTRCWWGNLLRKWLQLFF